MAKTLLTLDFEPDYFLVGVSSHFKDYRLCWSINKRLGIDLYREEDVLMKIRKSEEDLRFSFYTFTDENDYLTYHLVSNKTHNGYLIPERKEIDYFVQVFGLNGSKEEMEVLYKLKNSPGVILALYIDHNQLKSKDNLLF